MDIEQHLPNEGRHQQLLSSVLPSTTSRWLAEINARPGLLSPTLPPLRPDADTPAVTPANLGAAEVPVTRSSNVFFSQQV